MCGGGAGREATNRPTRETNMSASSKVWGDFKAKRMLRLMPPRGGTNNNHAKKGDRKYKAGKKWKRSKTNLEWAGSLESRREISKQVSILISVPGFFGDMDIKTLKKISGNEISGERKKNLTINDTESAHYNIFPPIPEMFHQKITNQEAER